MQDKILELFKKVIKENYSLEIDNLKLEIPPKKELWDFAFWWFQLSKDLKKNPNLIVEELKSFLEDYILNDISWEKLIESVEVSWPYLNIKLNKTIIVEQFIEFVRFYDCFDKTNNSKTIFIDYIWANVWKPLHIGHMCTPNQGQVMINLYKKLWYKVVSDSHLWDWWIIFWKLILAYKLFWDENKLKENAVEHLFELYVKITKEAEKDDSLEQKFRDEFKELSIWNLESVKYWKEFTKYSIESMNRELSRLNIKPDFNIWESFYEWLNLPKIEDIPDLKYSMKDVVKELIEKWIATKNDDNSVWVIFPPETKIPSCILQKRDWTHGYLASDLASIKYRMDNWNPEKIVYFVDIRQQLHLQQVFEISAMAWWIDKNKLIHAYNWFISLKDWAMSTRKWRIIKLHALLDEAEERAEKIILEKRSDLTGKELKNLSKIIWIWAIKYWYLSKSRTTDVVFDLDEFMTFEWNSWPYIQYAYVRAKRILENVWENASKNIDFIWNYWNLKEEVISLIKTLLKYSDVLEESVSKNMPHILANYAYELTKDFNSFYNNVSIINEIDEDLKRFMIMVTQEFIKIIEAIFSVLAIGIPESM